MSLRLLTHMGRKPEGLRVVMDNEDFFMKQTIHMLDERVNGLTKHTDNNGRVTPGYIVDYDGDDKCDVIIDNNPEWHYTSVKEVNS